MKLGDEMSLDALYNWLKVSALLVIVGVFLEEGQEIWSEIKESGWRTIRHRCAKIGFVLLVVGLCLELLFQTRIESVDAELKRESDTKIAQLGKEADKARAAIAQSEAETAKANEAAAKANEQAADLEKQATNLRIELEKERTSTSARSLTKEQFDAIQEIKGNVTDVGIIVQDKCLECRSYAIQIELALNEAGVTLHGEDVWLGENWEGVKVYIPTPQNAPNAGEILLNHPLEKALTNGAIPHHVSNLLNCAECRKDIPVIEIGDIQRELLTMPYAPKGQRSWTKLPLKK
jgi:hypothetical protein